MLKRTIEERLISWKNDENKKALCILGTRQVGKTTIVREFAQKHYECFVEINFTRDADAYKIFEGSFIPNDIIEKLTAYTFQTLVPNHTLVFLDEIQDCPRARAAIKFLVEDGRFDYIESGSLLGLRSKEIPSYAVGFEEIVAMVPMDFYEFAVANGLKPSTYALLENCYEEEKEVPELIHGTMLKLFYAYIVVGGMPDVVQTYIDTHDIARVVERQKAILDLYRLDIAKYAKGSDKKKIQSIFDCIPSQLNSKNRRFFLSMVDQHARMERYENAFLWLSDAGVAYPVYNVREPQAPLVLNENRSLLKLFMNDTGLLCAACMDPIQFDVLNGNVSINMGSILENVMAQALKSNGFDLYYYDSKKYGEVDFVIQRGMDIDLIEIKSGNDYEHHLSLDKMMKIEAWKFKRRIVFNKGNVKKDGDLNYFPWYMVMFYKPYSLPESMIYEVDMGEL